MDHVLPPSLHPPHQILLLLVALTLIRGLLYASFTPPWWQGHDEDFHFAQVRLLTDRWLSPFTRQGQNWPQEMVATFAAFPRGRWTYEPETQVDLVNLPARYTTVSRFSLSYYLYIWLNRGLAEQDILVQLLALRLVSVLMTCGTIVLAFLSARQLFGDSALSQILVPWLILFNPAFMVVGSTVSDANLAILLATVVFYLLLLEISQPYPGWRVLVALGLTGLAFFAKATTFFLLPVWGILLFVYARNLKYQGRLWLGLVGMGLLIVLMFTLSRFQEWREILQYALTQSGGLRLEGLAYAFSPFFFWYTFAFFWIILGWSVYWLAPIWYLILFFFCFVCLLGVWRYAWRQVKAKESGDAAEQKRLLLALLFVGGAIAVLIGLGIIRYQDRDGRSARYLFPVIVPLASLMVTGWREVLPPSWRNAGFVILAAAFFLFDTLVWLDFALPWYYPLWPH